MRNRYTFGVEEEYQLVTPEEGELVSRAAQVLRADRSGEVEGEAHETMVEIGTPVSTTADGLTEALRQRRFQAGAAAATEDLEIVATGTHPTSEWRDHSPTDAERPRMLLRRFREIMRQGHIYGMHIHVAIPENIDRLHVMNRIRPWAPHLIALAASSPFMLGEDTGFDSFRSVSWRRFPFTGVPPRFASEAEYDDYIQTLVRGGAIPDPRTVYWSIRPSSRYRTLELRMCDVCPRLTDAVGIAALARALVVAAAENELPDYHSGLSPGLQDEILTENEWLAARDGLSAYLIAPEHPAGKIELREDVGRLVERVRPISHELGDEDALDAVHAILENGNGADHARQIFAAERNLHSVVDWAIRETRLGTGLDRRSESRT